VPLPDPLRPLENRAFRVYWLGQTVSLVGTWMQQMAQGWIVTRLTPSASVVGSIALCTAIPTVLFGLKGGALADRRDRRSILLVTQSLLGLLALTLAVLSLTNTLALPHVFAVACAFGVIAAFDLPASQSLAPQLVPQPHIARAVGLMQASFHGSRLLGPAIAGVVILRLGEGAAFLANALSFLAVLGSLLAIGAVPPATLAVGGASEQGFGAGLGYVRTDPVLSRLLLLVFACMALAFPFLVALMPYYARYVLEVDAAAMGTLMSCSGLGALSGTVVLVFAAGRAFRPRIAIGLLLVGVCLTALGHARSLHVALALVAALSFGTSIYMGTISQVVQSRVPNELRGRVMALFTIGFVALMPTSGFVLSILADLMGLDRVMTFAAAAFVIVSGGCSRARRTTRPRRPRPALARDDRQIARSVA
jgi:MFS family permease